MMKRFFIVFCLCLSSVGALASDWVFIKEEKRVKTYRRDVPDSPLKQFKGEMLMNAPLSKVAHVLIKSDTETRLRWTSRLFKFSVFEEEADRLVYYTAFDLPWPIADRDYVLEGKLKEMIRNESYSEKSLHKLFAKFASKYVAKRHKSRR